MNKNLNSIPINEKLASSKIGYNEPISPNTNQVDSTKKNLKKDFFNKKETIFTKKPKAKQDQTDPKKNLSTEQNRNKVETILKSIPTFTAKKRIKFKGITLIALLIAFSTINFAFYVIAVQNTEAIGISSTGPQNNLSTRLFFLFITDFWRKFIFSNTYTPYSFFNNLSNNLNYTSTPIHFQFALAFYIFIFSGIVLLCLAIALFSIAIYQRLWRNVWISIFSLFPLLGPCLCLYYLGVYHYEYTFKIQTFLNKDNILIKHESDLKEQLIQLSNRLEKKEELPKHKEAFDKKSTIVKKTFSFDDPLGQKR